MKIALGSDHAGFELKEDLRVFLIERQVEVLDLGAFSEAPVDYPDVAMKAAEKVSRREVDKITGLEESATKK